MRLQQLAKDTDAAWDDLVASTPESGFMQSSGWSAFKRLEGFDTLRYGFFDDDHNLRGGASLLFYNNPLAESLYICPEGPVIPWSALPEARSCLRALIAELENRSQSCGGLGLRIEPRVGLPRPSLLRNWTRSPVDLNPVHSLVIDIGGVSAEDVLAQMHPKGRYNIRVAERHGVIVKRSRDLHDVRLFFSLFSETALRNGFFAEPYSFFINLCSTLFPVGMAELFFSQHAEETLATVLVIWFGKRATYLYGGSSIRKRSYMPTYALHWNIMLAAREMGCEEYDLYGFDPYDQPGHPYSGFSRFKRQFGGRQVDVIGAHDLIFYDRLADRVIEKLLADASQTA